MLTTESAAVGSVAGTHVTFRRRTKHDQAARARICLQAQPLLLPDLAGRAPQLPGAGTVAFTGIDSMQKRVYGPPEAGRGVQAHEDPAESLLVRGLNALAATISTPLAAPVIAAIRLRGGNAASARSAASFAGGAVATVRAGYCHVVAVAGEF